jgi:CDP-diglyceride synthetase
MRDEVGVLIGLTYFGIQISPSKGWAAFLTGVLHSSSHRLNSISVQQTLMGPTGFLLPRPLFGLGSMETEQQS